MKTIDHRVMCFEVSVGRSGHLIKRFRYANQSACYDLKVLATIRAIMSSRM